MPSRFGPRRPFIATKGMGLDERNYFAMRGLNMYQPDETLPDTNTPFAKNFRLFDPQTEGSRVAISKRLGHTFYSVPVGETDRGNLISTTGAADQSMTTVTQLAQKFTVSASGNLTKVELNIKNDSSGTAPMIVCIYTDSAGSPGTCVATSSIKSADVPAVYAYTGVRFIEAPSVATSTDYWIVAYIQTEGTNNYKWSSTTSATTAKVSTTSGNTWSTTSYALNYKVYVSTDGPVKGQIRFYTSTAAPQQIFAHGTNLYKVTDATGATTSVKSGLNSAATSYKFAAVNDKLYFVNGADTPFVYDGSSTAIAGGSPPVAVSVVLHKNRLFYLTAGTNRVDFTDLGAYETIGSTNFLYVPSPKTADPVIAMVSYQDNLVFFTKTTKYILYGSDFNSFVLKESTAKTGAAGLNAVCRDDNFIYFLSYSGLHKFNGGSDQLLSEKIDPLLSQIADFQTVRLAVADDKVHIHYKKSGDAVEADCLMFDLKYNEWLHDTDCYTKDMNTWESQTDTQQILASSSRVGQLFYYGQGYSDLGRPIDFEYRTKYFSFDHPSRKHRIKRLYPYLRAGESNYNLTLQIDADYANNPTNYTVPLYSTTSTIWGGGSAWGGGYIWGGNILQPTRLTIPGQNRLHQIRFKQYGAENPVKIIGFTIYSKMRRAV